MRMEKKEKEDEEEKAQKFIVHVMCIVILDVYNKIIIIVLNKKVKNI